MYLNKVILIGNVTQTPEMKQTSGGQNVVSFSIATNRSYKDSSGQKVESTDYHNIVAWGKLAEIVSQYADKGKQLYIEGRLQTRSWEDQSGAKQYRTEIVAEIIQLGSGGNRGGSSSMGDSNNNMMNSVSEVPAAKSKPKHLDDEEISIEDVPF